MASMFCSRVGFSGAVAGLAFGGLCGHPASAATDAWRAEDLSFEIRRDGQPVGEHRVTFTRYGDTVDVQARSEIAVPFLFFTAYRFSYQSRSRWRGGRIEQLDAVTDDNGAVSRVLARRDGGRVTVEGPAGRVETSPDTFVTEHWNSQVLQASTVLNTITGSVNRVDIAPQGAEAIESTSGTRMARRFSYTGDLQVTVWYDEAGRWVGLRFTARDGSRIDYVCRHCGADASPNSSTGHIG
jgi:hypothetical protein